MLTTILRRSALILAAFALFISARDGLAQFPKKTIRVAVLQDVDSLTLSVSGRYDVLDAKSGQLITRQSNLSSADVRSQNGSLVVGGMRFSRERIRFSPRTDASVSIKTRRMRGTLDVIQNKSGKLTAVNTLDLEEYVKGVLYHEISNLWGMEAIKAQAVATRTYAIYRMAQAKFKDFDVTSDIYSQVYGGRNSEKYRTTMAVNRTERQVMTYQGHILPAYFHATCGGYTEDVSELWKQDMLPLKGVPCRFCLNSPHYRWKKNYRLKDIQDKLNANGYRLGLIKEIAVVERDVSGRIRLLKITSRDGATATIAGHSFREIIGPNDIRSNIYEIVMKGYYMDLIGKGWGHGVGMCQWGAAEMAREHYPYDKILKYYYPGVDIADDELVSY